MLHSNSSTDEIIRELVLYNGMTLSEAHRYMSNAIDDYAEQKREPDFNYDTWFDLWFGSGINDRDYDGYVDY